MSLLTFIFGLIALAGIYTMFTIALNVSSGILGLWDLGVAGYVAIGAYSYVLIVDDGSGLGMPMWIGMIAAIVITAILSLGIGYTSLRLKNEYFLITSFAFAEIIRTVIMNEAWLTKGNVGVYGIDKPFEEVISGRYYMLFLTAIILLGVLVYYYFAQRLTNSPMGRLMRALRENEQVAISIGKNIFHTRLKLFVLSSGMAGLAGCFYVWYMSIVAPNIFISTMTFTVWTAIILGGIGNNHGAVIGAFILILTQEATRFIPVPSDYGIMMAGLRTIITGLLLILVLRFRPGGLLKEKNKSVEKIYHFGTESSKPEGGVSHASS